MKRLTFVNAFLLAFAGVCFGQAFYTRTTLSPSPYTSTEVTSGTQITYEDPAPWSDGRYGVPGAIGFVSHTSNNQDFRSLFKFDLSSIPANAVIHSATLTAWLTGDPLTSDGAVTFAFLIGTEPASAIALCSDNLNADSLQIRYGMAYSSNAPWQSKYTDTLNTAVTDSVQAYLGNRHLILYSFSAEDPFGGNSNAVVNMSLEITWYVPQAFAVTFQNNFTGGVMGIVGPGVSSSSQGVPYTDANTQLGSPYTVTAVAQQDNSGINRVWNNYAPNNQSSWQKQVGQGPATLASPAQTYSFNADTSDLNATYTANLRQNFEISRNDETEFDGTILRSNVTQILEQNSGTVPAPATQTINGRNYNFAGWENGGNGVITNPTSNMTYPDAAMYKTVHYSNDASAFSNNSQRKFVRIPDSQGHMFQVYTSMGHAWLESSTDGGQTWKLEYGGHPLDNTDNGTIAGPGSKCPSIDYYYNSSSGVDYVVVVFEEPYGNSYTIDYLNLHYDSVTGHYDYGDPRAVYTETADSFSVNANPNIAIGSGGAIITFERKSSSGGAAGINWKVGTLDGEGNITLSPFVETISGTNANSVDATVYCSKATNPLNFFVAAAWEQDASTSSKTIEFTYLSFNYNNSSWSYSQSPVQNISDNLGFPLNYRPSIAEAADNTVRVCWILDQTGTGMPQFITVAYWNQDNPSGYGIYDMNPQSVSINIADDGTTCFVWSSQISTYWYDRASTGTTLSMTTLNASGKDVQVCNADTKSNMYVSSFYPFSAPYYFSTSTSLGGVAKASPTQVFYGRGLTLGEGNLRFHYSLGNLLVDGKSINFVTPSSSASHGNLDSLNSVLETEPFQISNNSKFMFTEDCGFLDSAAAAVDLGDTGYVSYKAELVDNSTGKVIGTIRDATFNSRSTHLYTLVPYQLNTDGVGTKTVRVKFAVTTNIDSPQVAFVNSYQYQNQIDSSSIQSVLLQQLDLIKDYVLAQNYPNPFNPTTTISYTIPKDGMVTLKIYDVLGREVETLVNQVQKVGRYEVNFDASRLASGVYFYRLVSGSHVITKKLMLLK